MMSKILLGVGAIPLTLYLGLLLLMYLFQDRLLFIPSKLEQTYAFSFTRQFEEVFLDVDGARLNGLVFEHPEPRGVILYFHGNAGALDSWGDVAEDFSAFPYHFVIFDYRGYGKSTGVNASEAQMQADGLAIFKYARARYSDLEMTIIGRSLGTGIASWLAKQIQPQLLILETPYVTLPKLVKIIYPFVPTFLVRYEFDNERWIRDANYPVHLIHGNRDQLIPHRCSESLARLGNHVSMHTIHNAEHNNLSSFRAYHEALKRVFQR